MIKKKPKPKSRAKPKSEHKASGRPTVMTPEVIAKIEYCISRGYNDYESFHTAGVSRDAFYDYLKKDVKFADKIQWLRSNTNILSKEIVFEKLLEKDILTAKWLLERKAKDEYSTRNELTAADGEQLTIKTVFIEPEEKEAYLKQINETISKN